MQVLSTAFLRDGQQGQTGMMPGCSTVSPGRPCSVPVPAVPNQATYHTWDFLRGMPCRCHFECGVRW